MSTEEDIPRTPAQSDRLADALRMAFPSWNEPIGERPVEPTDGEVKRVAGRMGCQMEDARIVARHRRAIRALREAEQTNYYRHIEELERMVESELLLGDALPADFGNRLDHLRTLKRKRGRPMRSIFRSLVIKWYYDCFRSADLAIFDRFGASKRQEKSQIERGARYSDIIEELADTYRTSPRNIEKTIQKAQESEHSYYHESLWESDYDRFWRWASGKAVIHRVVSRDRRPGDLIT